MHWRGLEFITFGLSVLCQLIFSHGQLLPCATSTLPVYDSWQSSSYQGTFIQRLIAFFMGYPSAFSANNAVDGESSGTISGACAQTQNEIYPWWQAQLDGSYYVTSIAMALPESCDTCPAEFKSDKILVEIGEVSVDYDNAGWNTEWNARKRNCSFLSMGHQYSSAVVNCSKPIVGNFIRLTKLNTEETTLSLCEVEISGYLNCTYSGIDLSVSATIVSTASANKGDHLTSQSIRTLGSISSTTHDHVSTNMHSSHPLLTQLLMRHSSTTIVPTATTKNGGLVSSQSVGELHTLKPSTSSVFSTALRTTESSLSHASDELQNGSKGVSAMSSNILKLTSPTPSVVLITSLVSSSQMFEDLYTEGQGITSTLEPTQQLTTTVEPAPSIGTQELSLQPSFSEMQSTSSDTSYESSSIIEHLISSISAMTYFYDSTSYDTRTVSSSADATRAVALPTSQPLAFATTPASTPALVSWISSRYTSLSTVSVSFTSLVPRTTLEDPSTLATGVVSSTSLFKLNVYSSQTLLPGSFTTVSSKVESSTTTASSLFSQPYSDIRTTPVTSTTWNTGDVARRLSLSPFSVIPTAAGNSSLKTSSSVTKLKTHVTACTYHSSSLSVSSSSVIASIYSSVIPVWCPCTCNQAELIASFTNNNKTTEQVAEEIEEALSEMTVDSKTTSINERKLLSANDKRDSAKVIGTAGVVFCTTIIILIVLSDLPVLIVAVKGILRQQIE